MRRNFRTTLRLLPALLLAGVLLAAGGCRTGTSISGGRWSHPPEATDRFDAVVLQAVPTAVNFDDRPGADGLRVSVSMFQLDKPLSLAISDGMLEFLLYDSEISAEEARIRPPIRTWQYSGELLDARRMRTLVGWGYKMTLDWREEVPTCKAVTLMARYHSPSGPPVDSAALTVQVGGPGMRQPDEIQIRTSKSEIRTSKSVTP